MKKISALFFKEIILCVGIGLSVFQGGCKSTPVVSAHADQPTQSVTVTGSQNHRVKRSVESIAASAGDARDITLQRHIAAMAEQGGPPLISDNDAKLLIDGPQAYGAMFSAMELARNNINLEVYIFQDDKVGRDLINILLKKQQQGIQVKLIYDGLGSVATAKSLFEPLTDAGVQVFEFNPVNPVEGKTLEINNRDHRKILVVDGEVGFTGGINISSVYSHGSATNPIKAAKDHPPLDEGWRDTQIEIRGPAVAELQRVFFKTWDSQFDSDHPDPKPPLSNVAQKTAKNNPGNYYPDLPRQGDKIVRVIASTPDDKKNIIYADLLMAIRHAQSSIHLTMAYFSPDAPVIEALRDASKRGVEVTLELPGFSDIWLIFEAGRSHYSTLLDAGVIIYERHDALLHAKTAVIDGVWSTVGSSNMDMRSFLHNSEVNIVVIGSDFGDAMEAMFQHDLTEGTLITEQAWRQRPLTDRLRQWFSRVWSYWL
ncbi:MAG: cls [Verrucomicrobiaceae bacterium]|nr:cls [Verrucomicrobiaceae bacterium]